MPAATAAREGSSGGSSLTISRFSSPKGGRREPSLPFPPVSNPPKEKSKTCAYVKAWLPVRPSTGLSPWWSVLSGRHVLRLLLLPPGKGEAGAEEEEEEAGRCMV